MKPTLNVGCGTDPWGDVRVDIMRYSPYSFLPTSVNVVADVQYLPFRSNSFSVYGCFHVLEHVSNPRAALQEVRRVSDIVIVRVPIWHLYSFLIGTIALFLYVLSRKPYNIKLATLSILRWKNVTANTNGIFLSEKLKSTNNTVFQKNTMQSLIKVLERSWLRFIRCCVYPTVH